MMFKFIHTRWPLAVVGLAMFAAGFVTRGSLAPEVAHAQGSARVFEMRTYTAAPGKFEALKARFRNHTLRIFEKEGMTNIGYWIPADPPNSENTLIYILAHKDREAARKSWEAFRNDPEWKKVASESQKEGPLTAKPPESVYLTPADFSPIK